jgi:endonuclease G
MRFFNPLTVCLVISVCPSTWAADCKEHYWQGQAPIINNAALKQKTRDLCFSGFVVMHSGVTRTPIWVGEYLTASRLKKARDLDRQDSFHEEERLPENERATLADYRGSGYDRGHMAPNGDMANRQQQSDSFSLANMVPQSPTNNREVWRNLEEATRALVMQEGEAYVLTGAAFLSPKLKKVGQVYVPTDVYKVVYFPKRQAASAYFAPNDESGKVSVISVAQLEQKIGVNLLPKVAVSVKNKKIDLPISTQQVDPNELGQPVANSQPQSSAPPASSPASHSTDWLSLILQVLQSLLK